MFTEQIPHFTNQIFWFGFIGWILAIWFGITLWQARKEIKRLSKPFGYKEYYKLWNELDLSHDAQDVLVKRIRAIQKTLVKKGIATTVVEEADAKIKEHETAIHQTERDQWTVAQAQAELMRESKEDQMDSAVREKLQISIDEIARLINDMDNRRDAIAKLRFKRSVWNFALTGVEPLELKRA